MEQVFTILYEDSTPARKKISFYNALAANAGLPVQWLQKSAFTNGYVQLQAGDADAILISGREDFNELREKHLTVLISKQHERRLVALFSPSIEPVYFGKQYTPTYPLTIAADFEWQAQMVANFLSAALPLRTIPYTFMAIGDDHGFDDRLTALFDGRIDIAILPLADLNEAGNATTRKLKHMVLPLFECPPNIYQATTGLILKNGKSLLADAVQHSGDVQSIENYLAEALLLIQKVPALIQNVPASYEVFRASYGVFRMNLPLAPFTYLAGPDQQRTNEIWKMDAALPVGKKILSTTNYMKDFFRYNYLNDEKVPAKPVCFIASHKSIHNERLVIHLAGRRVWAAGTKTWFELAKKGVWVEGSADGLGLETLTKAWTGVFTGIDKDSVNILTNSDSANQWLIDGWSATGTYELIPSMPPEILKRMEAAEVVFWTSYQQYQACREFVNPGVLHASPAGKTAWLLKKNGIENLVVFPSIKAFNWYLERVYTKLPDRESRI
ncbi:hypothetical protein [Flavitalea sp.]|nr:hypothetical protein [Flavitalea sp.]